MTSAFLKSVENYWHDLLNHADKEIIEYATPALDYIKANGGKAILLLAEGVLSGAAAGTPWAALSASLLVAAEQEGIALAEGAASSVLNFAKTNLAAKSIPSA